MAYCYGRSKRGHGVGNKKTAVPLFFQISSATVSDMSVLYHLTVYFISAQQDLFAFLRSDCKRELQANRCAPIRFFYTTDRRQSYG